MFPYATKLLLKVKGTIYNSYCNMEKILIKDKKKKYTIIANILKRIK